MSDYLAVKIPEPILMRWVNIQYNYELQLEIKIL